MGTALYLTKSEEELLMGIKKTLGLGVASAALGLSLIGGGTFAYFSDKAPLDTQTFTAGTLDLSATATTTTTIALNNLKPGDIVKKEIQLRNIGSLDFGKLF